MNTINLRSGPISPLLIRLGLPVLAGQAFNLLYNIVDTWFIAQINPSDPYLVGATGLVFPLFFIFLAASFGISGGVSSLVARAIGAGRAKELDQTAESALALALSASTVIMLFMYPFAVPLLQLFGGKGLLLEYGLEYLLWLLPTVPFMLAGAVFTGILQGEGRTKHMMMAMMIGTIANIVLDPLLIFGARMGIAGAAFATCLSNALSLVYLVVVFLIRTSNVTIHWKISNISSSVIVEILRVGLPQSVLNLLSSISFIFYNRIMTDIDPVVLTSFTLYSRLEQIALIPIWSLSSAVAAIAGQAAGAGDIKRMKQTLMTSTWMGILVCGLLLLGYVLVSPWLFAAFQTDSQVLATAGQITPWMATATFFVLPVFMITTIMSTAGFAGMSLAFTAYRIYFLNVPFCMLGAYVIGKTMTSVLGAIVLASLLTLGSGMFAGLLFFRALETGRLKIRMSAVKE
ncbi:MATE family efflux transporter [Gracilinema caldarium]|uniref:MATE efflux family protein n=1 Tax=Gracilinema caldarium (strain ATCC 51460 / DSM 7334 / H1) TaxID=744872 RepID=F8F2D4_GRAC1|nr:MATE family efflux transporter [Gracilinema caldarium]AEJ20916.1 MATE efflux family protein [Gracilinema caldarium DSM 7334]